KFALNLLKNSQIDVHAMPPGR
ncbi:MAG: hypothetical protein RL016_635, partial [Actinomycetota bacterium]